MIIVLIKLVFNLLPFWLIIDIDKLSIAPPVLNTPST